MREPDGILSGHVLMTVNLDGSGTASGEIDVSPYILNGRRYRLDAVGLVIESGNVDLTEPVVDQSMLAGSDRKVVLTLAWAGISTEPILTVKGRGSVRRDRMPATWDGRITVSTSAFTGGGWYTAPMEETGWAWVELAWWEPDPADARAAACRAPW